MNRLFCFAAALLLSACGDTSSEMANTEAAPATPEERGRIAFNECAICHTAKQGEPNRVGPNLYGIVGNGAGLAEGFVYSKALQQSEITWTEETLDAFIENPAQYLRGNRMAYAGLRDAERRADLIAYLKTLQPAAE